jgi:hypothetical protein
MKEKRTMPTRLYFDLAAVTELAVHAVLAERSLATDDERADDIQPRPALRLYRTDGDVYLRTSGSFTQEDLARSRRCTARTITAHALTTPCVQPPDRHHPVVLALLQPEHQPLIDQLHAGLADGADLVAVDPLTNSVGVGRRRWRIARALAGRPQH